MRKIIRFLSSVKLAVFVFLFLSLLISIGTIIESKYDGRAARLVVYDSWWMYAGLILLSINLLAVILDRYPWKYKHLSFILAHLGVIVLVGGGWLTSKYGVQGTLRLTPKEKVHQIVLPEMVLALYKSSDGEQFQRVWEEPFEAQKAEFSKEHPFQIRLSDMTLDLIEAVPYGVPKMLVESSTFSQSGAGLRFLISNTNVSFSDWLVQRTVFEKVDYQAGPLVVTMGGLWERLPEANEIRLVPKSEGLEYAFYHKKEMKPYSKGFIKEGDSSKTAWMNFNFKVMRYYSKASVRWVVQAFSRSTSKTVPAVKVLHQGVESWLITDDYLKIFTEKNVYLLSYMNRRVDLPISIELVEFQKTNHPGSMRAMSYKSHVKYESKASLPGEAVIAMNEPLKMNGFYFYQAGFEEFEDGRAKASILSVNQDPGRVLKYLGSFMMCLGTILLFYFKKKNPSKSEQIPGF